MVSVTASASAGVFAHPVSGHPHVNVPVVLVAGVGALVVLLAAVLTPRLRARPDDSTRPATGFASWAGSLWWPQAATRVLGVALLLLAVATGRLGVDDELENLAPALVVGVAWPLLAALSLLVGPVWRWVDPWDGIARVFDRGARAQPAQSVWPAVVVAFGVVWFFSAYQDVLSPRAVGTALAVYTIVTVAGCVALGRARWLSSGEPLGLTFTWMAMLPRRRLSDWEPPRGAEALLGVLIGGLLFGLVRRAEVWSGLVAVPWALAYATLGLLLLCVAFGGVLVLAGQLAATWRVRAGVAQAVVPVAGGVVMAVALERSRFFTSLQLLPGLFGDPFGQGWDLFGPTLSGLNPALVSEAGLITIQLGVLLLACVAGAVVASLRVADRIRRLPVGLVNAYLAVACVVAISLH